MSALYKFLLIACMVLCMGMTVPGNKASSAEVVVIANKDAPVDHLAPDTI
jgi:hypothetical protein